MTRFIRRHGAVAILFGDSMRSTNVQYSGLHALSGEPRARVAWRFGVGCDEGRMPALLPMSQLPPWLSCRHHDLLPL